MLKLKCLGCLRERWVRRAPSGDVQTKCLRCRRGNHAKHPHSALKRIKRASPTPTHVSKKKKPPEKKGGKR